MSEPTRTAQAPVIRISSMDAGYEEHKVLGDINLEVYRGEVLALIGQSGCGKSTLLRCIAGLLPPMSGVVEVLGHKLPIRDELERRLMLSRMGVVFQQNALLGSMTVADNVALPVMQHTKVGIEVARSLALSKLALVGLDGWGDRLPAELSGGMQKRAALARAIALEPELLLCDEPIAGLDPVVASGIDRLITSLARRLGMTVLMVTHELASILTVVTRAVLIVNGVVHAVGAPRELEHSEDEKVNAFFHRIPPDEAAAGVCLLERLEEA
jgi:phospholipid/cholesterol/gamma-HCH transport system ATP-binding protein